MVESISMTRAALSRRAMFGNTAIRYFSFLMGFDLNTFVTFDLDWLNKHVVCTCAVKDQWLF